MRPPREGDEIAARSGAGGAVGEYDATTARRPWAILPAAGRHEIRARMIQFANTLAALRTARRGMLPVFLALFAVACQQGEQQPRGGDRGARVHLVEVTAAATRPLSHVAVRSGTLRVRQEVKLFNQEEGRVAELAVREGDAVARDQLLVRLDDTLILADLDKAVATRDQARFNLERLRSLMGKRLVSEDELSRGETQLRVAEAEEQVLRTRLAFTRLRAPFDGVIAERHVEPGDVIPRFTHVLTVVDLDTLYTSVEVSELLIPSLSVGQPASVRVDALGDREFEGRIERIHPTIDPRTRQGVIEVALTPVPEGAQPGQLCRVTLESPPVPRRVVPFTSLRRDNDGEYVFVVGSDAVAARRAVNTGLRIGSEVELLDGVGEGEAVVTRGFLGLRDGLEVKVVDASAAGS